MQKTELDVKGMHCEGCESRIKKMLPRIDSVDDVTADRNTEKVTFSSDGTPKTLNAVKEKITELGYQVV
jgi:copper chaperone CopZ